MKDRFTPGVSFLIALAFHVLLVVLATQQYIAATQKPERLNQAAQRLSTVNGRPVRFVYVKDMIPTKEPPMDPSRLSDLNRRGASPDPRKGTSPDPTSYGGSPLRQFGGPGNAPFSRPSVAPAMPSPRPERGSPASQGQEQSREEQAQGRQGGRAPKPATNEASKLDSGTGRGADMGGKASDAEKGLPVGGAQQPSAGNPPGAPTSPYTPPRAGLGTQIQNMMLGSMQGGYNNPNASRLNTGALSFDTAGWDLGPYARRVQEKVQSNWHVPEAQMVLRQKGWVAIRFNVQKDGTVTDLQVIRPSGIPSYDQSALDALRSSNPLPPLPSEVTVPHIGGVFRFFYNMGDEGE